MRVERKARSLVLGLAAAAVLAIPGVAAACPVCFGEASGPMADAVNNGILFMLGVVGAVQFGFVALFVGMWRRHKRYQDHKDAFEIIDGGTR
jgi:hypothetical protein